MFSVLGPTPSTVGSSMASSRSQGLHQLVHGAVAQLRVSGMGHGAVGADFRPQRSFGGQRQAVVGGLAVDEEAAALGVQIGHPRSRRIALLTHHEQQRGRHPGLAQPLGGGHLRGDNPLGVAGPPSIEEEIVLAAGDKRRHGIHVRGKHHIRPLAIAGIQVEAWTAVAALRRLRNRRPFHGKAPLAQKGVEILPYRSLVIGERFNVYQAARQVKRIERLHRCSA